MLEFGGPSSQCMIFIPFIVKAFHTLFCVILFKSSFPCLFSLFKQEDPSRITQVRVEEEVAQHPLSHPKNAYNKIKEERRSLKKGVKEYPNPNTQGVVKVKDKFLKTPKPPKKNPTPK